MLTFFVFLLGLGIGSFLNVLIWRLPREENFVKGRSRCPFCHHTLDWKDLIPLASFIFLKRKCRYCSKKISWRYFGVELVTALLFLALWPSFFWIGTASLLMAVIFIDFDHLIIPDKILTVLAVWALLFQLTHPANLYNHGMSAVISGLVFLLIFLATKGQKMGLGDVKLMFLLGFIFGFPGILIVFYLAVAGALIWSIILILFFGGQLKTKLPFGSLLAGASLVFILFSQLLLKTFTPYILRFYL